MGNGRDLAWWRIPPGATLFGGPRALGLVVSGGRKRPSPTAPDPRPARAATRIDWGLRPVRRMRSMVTVALFVFSIYAAQLARLAGSPAVNATAPQTLSLSLIIGIVTGRLLGASRNPWAKGVEDSPAITPYDAYRSERRYALMGGGLVTIGAAIVLGLLLGPRVGALGGVLAGRHSRWGRPSLFGSRSRSSCSPVDGGSDSCLCSKGLLSDSCSARWGRSISSGTPLFKNI